MVDGGGVRKSRRLGSGRLLQLDCRLWSMKGCRKAERVGSGKECLFRLVENKSHRKGRGRDDISNMNEIINTQSRWNWFNHA